MKDCLIFFGILSILSGCSSKINPVPVTVKTNDEFNNHKKDIRKNCSIEIGTVKYNDNNGGFPVTIRKTSSCTNKGGK